MSRRFFASSIAFLLFSAVATAQRPATSPALGYEDSYQLNVVQNLQIADSLINISNAGFHTAPNLSSRGFICANVYAFSPDEQIVSCCSCAVSRNGVKTLSAKNDLVSNSLLPGVTSSVTIKLVSTIPTGGIESSTTCNPAILPITNPLAGIPAIAGAYATGIRAWATHFHQHAITGNAAFQFGTETEFSQVPMSEGERTNLAQLCAFIQSNGSGFGICKSCRLGALGGTKGDQ